MGEGVGSCRPPPVPPGAPSWWTTALARLPHSSALPGHLLAQMLKCCPMSDNGTDVLRWEPVAVRPGWIGRQGTGGPSSSPWHAHTSLGSRVGQCQDPREPLPRPAPLPKPRTENRAVFPLPWALVLQLLEVCGCLTLEPQDLGWDGEGGGQPRRSRGACQTPRLLPTPQGQGPGLGLTEAPGPTCSEGTKHPL